MWGRKRKRIIPWGDYLHFVRTNIVEMRRVFPAQCQKVLDRRDEYLQRYPTPEHFAQAFPQLILDLHRKMEHHSPDILMQYTTDLKSKGLAIVAIRTGIGMLANAQDIVARSGRLLDAYELTSFECIYESNMWKAHQQIHEQ